MSNINRSNEEKLDICKMRIEGQSLQGIGEKYGISKQRVQQILQRLVHDPKVTWNGIVYPHIKNWLIENNMSMRQFSLSLHFDPQIIESKLKGRVGMNENNIIAIHDFTGLPYEQILEKEVKS